MVRWYVPPEPQPPEQGDLSDEEYQRELITFGEDQARWNYEYVKDCGHTIDQDCDCDTIRAELAGQD